jgi:uncharacterized membrane protein
LCWKLVFLNHINNKTLPTLIKVIDYLFMMIPRQFFQRFGLWLIMLHLLKTQIIVITSFCNTWSKRSKWNYCKPCSYLCAHLCSEKTCCTIANYWLPNSNIVTYIVSIFTYIHVMTDHATPMWDIVLNLTYPIHCIFVCINVVKDHVTLV